MKIDKKIEKLGLEIAVANSLLYDIKQYLKFLPAFEEDDDLYKIKRLVKILKEYIDYKNDSVIKLHIIKVRGLKNEKK